MDIVLPTCIARPDRLYSDLDRACLLARSLEVFLDPADAWTIHVVAADDELEAIRDRLGRFRLDLRYLTHSDVLDGVDLPPTKGWRKQQYLKLLVARKIDAPIYLSIDSDHILKRPLRPSDVVRSGRAMVTFEPRSNHARWWDGAATALDAGLVPDPAITISCVPMWRPVVLGLLDRLERLHGPGWARTLREADDWTEYALYYTFAHFLGRAEELHAPGPLMSLGRSLWYAEDLSTWDVDDAFADDAYFVCIQSHTDLPPEAIQDLTEPYLGPWEDAL